MRSKSDKVLSKLDREHNSRAQSGFVSDFPVPERWLKPPKVKMTKKAKELQDRVRKQLAAEKKEHAKSEEARVFRMQKEKEERLYKLRTLMTIIKHVNAHLELLIKKYEDGEIDWLELKGAFMLYTELYSDKL